MERARRRAAVAGRRVKARPAGSGTPSPIRPSWVAARPSRQNMDMFPRQEGMSAGGERAMPPVPSPPASNRLRRLRQVGVRTRGLWTGWAFTPRLRVPPAEVTERADEQGDAGLSPRRLSAAIAARPQFRPSVCQPNSDMAVVSRGDSSRSIRTTQPQPPVRPPAPSAPRRWPHEPAGRRHAHAILQLDPAWNSPLLAGQRLTLQNGRGRRSKIPHQHQG